MGRTSTLPYWLNAGTESCGGCRHTHVRESGYRCVACDGGVCMSCVIIERTTREVWCPSCHAEQDESER